MSTSRESQKLIFSNAAAYIVMMAVNTLAEILPLNGVTTEQVANEYPNLFTPAPITFAIWGVIYFLLALFVIYQINALGKNKHREEVISEIGIFFILSSLANSIWLICWHYKQMAFSLAFMLILLLSLMIIYTRINSTHLTKRDKAFIRLPFSIYFGWVTIALIANVTAWLVSIGWGGFGVPDQIWTIIAIIFGLIVCLASMYINDDIAYGLTFMWAYAGILIKHTSQAGYDWQYTGVIITACVAIVILGAMAVYILYQRKTGGMKNQ